MGNMRTNQSELWITRSLWLVSSLPRLPMVFWRGQKLCSRGLVTIVWSDSLNEPQCKVPFRYFLKVKLRGRDGHNLHKELNSALRIKCCSVITWNLQIMTVLPSSWVCRVCCADNESMHTCLGCQECLMLEKQQKFLKEYNPHNK